MRLKIRHATRRRQQDIDNEFNPINLDYIFEEDDPLTPWLENLEEPVLDGQDNSGWLSGDEDEVAPTTSCQPSTQRAGSDIHIASGSGSGEGLSSFSTIPSGSDPDNNPPPQSGHTAIHPPQEVDSSPRNLGHSDLHEYRDAELQHEDITYHRRSVPRGSTRRGSFRMSLASTDEVESDDDISQTMSELELRVHHSPPQPSHPYPYPPPYMYPQPYPYPVPHPYPYPYPYPHAQPMYYPLQQPHDPAQYIASRFFGPTYPHTSNHQSSEVSEQTEMSGSPMDTYTYNHEDTNDVEHHYQEPARNSFWY